MRSRKRRTYTEREMGKRRDVRTGGRNIERLILGMEKKRSIQEKIGGSKVAENEKRRPSPWTGVDQWGELGRKSTWTEARRGRFAITRR